MEPNPGEQTQVDVPEQSIEALTARIRELEAQGNSRCSGVVGKEFVDIVSHELRTPLTAVRITAEALLSGAKDDSELLDRFLRTIVSESERLSTLIEEIVDLALMDGGFQPSKQDRIPVSQIIDIAIIVIRPICREKNITLVENVPMDIEITCEKNRMVQAIRNLVDNAVKYTPSGGNIAIDALRCDGLCKISVKDDGIGIAPEYHAKIFDRFYRVRKSTSTQRAGTGLGLSIASAIIAAHRGVVTVDSQLGCGTTFTVSLPES